jgi:hypothetical protein
MLAGPGQGIGRIRPDPAGSAIFNQTARRCAPGLSGTAMTKAMRAWRKANFYVKAGRHDKALYWLARTQTILDRPPQARRRSDLDVGYMLAAAAALILIWISAPW